MSAVLALLMVFTGISSAHAAQTQPSEAMSTVGEDDACFQSLTDQQRLQLQPYVTTDPSTQGKGVCVLEPAADGTFTQHVYNEQDSSRFADYLLYALLARSCASGLFAYGYISGELTLVESILLSSWVNVDRYGYMYHPYSKYGSQGWARSRIELSGQVSQKRYGQSAPQVRVASQPNVTPPRGYTTPRTNESQGGAAAVRRVEAPRGTSPASSKFASTPGVKLPGRR